MNVIILAAGKGSRLGARTADVPKPALVVAGRPLLAYDVAFARRAGAARVAVVVGYRAEATTELARSLGVDEIVMNERWDDGGNLLSLFAARDLLDGGFVVMNADHVYNPAIADQIACLETLMVTALIDRDRSLGPDDMKVRLDGDQIVAIDKQLDAWDAGYIGLTFVHRLRVADYLYTAENVHREKGDGIHVEAVLGRMAGVKPAATLDVSGHGWVEIDDEADLTRAQEYLTKKAWYSL